LQLCPFSPELQSFSAKLCSVLEVLQSTDSQLDRSHSSGVGTEAVRFEFEFQARVRTQNKQMPANALPPASSKVHTWLSPLRMASHRVALISPSTPTPTWHCHRPGYKSMIHYCIASHHIASSHDRSTIRRADAHSSSKHKYDNSKLNALNATETLF